MTGGHPSGNVLARQRALRTELDRMPQEHCGLCTLATVTHADLVEVCAPLYAAIEELAHADEARSPSTTVSDDDDTAAPSRSVTRSGSRWLRLPQRGSLEASRRVLDAMRFDDLGRKSTILGVI